MNGVELDIASQSQYCAAVLFLNQATGGRHPVLSLVDDASILPGSLSLMSDTPLPSDSLTEQTESQPAEQSAVPDEAGSLSADDTPEEPLRTVTSAELLCGQRELLIEHEGEVYRLRVTRNSRLILQK